MTFESFIQGCAYELIDESDDTRLFAHGELLMGSGGDVEEVSRYCLQYKKVPGTNKVKRQYKICRRPYKLQRKDIEFGERLVCKRDIFHIELNSMQTII